LNVAWNPTTEAHIEAALRSGELAETHLLELKRDAPSGRGERSEIARDLASLALDGGSLLFGIEEVKNENRFQLAPVELPNQVEALEQIAELRIDPPLTIRAKEIPASSSETSGYIFVTVEASPLAPHMVDGVYYGRGEKRRRRLGDAEVLRLHRRREEADGRVLAMLRQDVDADPIPAAEATQGHLFLVASPVTGSPTLAEDWVWDQTAMFEVFQSSSVKVPESLWRWAPTPRSAHQLVRRSHGQAWTSMPDGSPMYEDGAVQVEFREDGSVHIFVGRLTATVSQRGLDLHTIMDGLVVAYVFRTIAWALRSAERSGYAGAWDLGIAGTGMHGALGFSNTEHFSDYDSTTYAGSSYEAITQATKSEMASTPNSVTNRLIKRLLRSMHLERFYNDIVEM
jgi:hypothetical protein